MARHQESVLMLRLARKIQESVVVNPINQEDKHLVIKVLDVSPTGTVGLGFEGGLYDITRTEIYNLKGVHHAKRNK